MNGLVLVVGGENKPAGTLLSSAELYNPTTGTFSPTGPLAKARMYHTATLLSDGRVLVVGGVGTAGTLASAEIYNPTTGTFSLAGTMPVARSRHAANLLASGKVLVVGGRSNTGSAIAAAELYDPGTGVFTPTGNMADARFEHMAVQLSGGKVLVAGGATGNARTLSSAEVYDPATGKFAKTGSMAQGRAASAAARLPNGRVLIAAGYAYCPGMNPIPSGAMCVDLGLASAEIYNPNTGKFDATGSMATARGAAGITMVGVLLLDGRVLIPGGGLHSGVAFNSTELYYPGSKNFGPAGSMSVARSGHTVTKLLTGRILVTGGYDGNTGTTLATAEVYHT